MVTNLFKALRPQQWIKNLSVLAPAFFAGQILNNHDWVRLSWAFLLLSAASSGAYLINDLLDRHSDRLHPLKGHRPIASGKLSPGLAAAVAVFLLTISLLTSLQFPIFFTLSLAGFIAVQLSYSLLLKHLILIDVMAIGATFSLRVFAGALILPVPLSAWLILTTVSLSLLLAIGKRRAEVTLLTHRLAAKHRDVVTHYPIVLLDGMTFVMAASTIMSYALFTFNQPELTTRKKLIDLLPQTLANPKWLMVTIPFVIYGIFRYLYVIYEKKEGSSPERVLIYDRPLLIAVLTWAAAAYFAIYIVSK